jgi:hypothetical protein
LEGIDWSRLYREAYRASPVWTSSSSSGIRIFGRKTTRKETIREEPTMLALPIQVGRALFSQEGKTGILPKTLL